MAGEDCNDPDGAKPSRSGTQRRTRHTKTHVSEQRLEELTSELFQLHDLNGNGLLEEAELIRLNEQIAILHHGNDCDTMEVRSKYQELFRTKLDPNGHAVPYAIFRSYAYEVLDALDTDSEAQEMILEQFVAEARSGRQAIGLSGFPGDRSQDSFFPPPLNLFQQDTAPAIDTHTANNVCRWFPECQILPPYQGGLSAGRLVQAASSARGPTMPPVRVVRGAGLPPGMPSHQVGCLGAPGVVWRVPTSGPPSFVPSYQPSLVVGTPGLGGW